MKDNRIIKNQLAKKELFIENRENKNCIGDADIFYESFFSLLLDITKNVQLSSASIEVAVSSLLNNEIFWDPANQHEFLETINVSASSISNTIVMLNLAFRAETGNLNLQKEPQLLQEILASVQTNIASKVSNSSLELSLSDSEKPVIVDYEYLSMALIYFICLLYENNNSNRIKLIAHEENNVWFLDFIGLDSTLIQEIDNLQLSKKMKSEEGSISLSNEDILRLHITNKIFRLQDISTSVIESKNELIIRLLIPGS